MLSGSFHRGSMPANEKMKRNRGEYGPESDSLEKAKATDVPITRNKNICSMLVSEKTHFQLVKVLSSASLAT